MANTATKQAPRFKQRYDAEIAPALAKKYGYENKHRIPKLQKIVLNMGVGEATTNKQEIDHARDQMTLLAGQKAVVTRTKKANASFKIREDQAIGVKVTLRAERMYEFLDRLVTIALPRVRDFRGVPGNSFDGRGNYAMGIKEHIVFPEINFDKVDKIRGMDIVICTTAENDTEAKELLKAFDMPFRN